MGISMCTRQKIGKLIPHHWAKRSDQVKKSWSSVVQGAVLRGMAVGSKIPPKVVLCRRHYGFSLNRGQIPSIAEGIWEVDPLDDNNFSQDQLIWLVQRRDIIFPDSELKKKIKLSYKTQKIGKASTITFLADARDEAPSRFKELSGKSCRATDSNIPVNCKVSTLLIHPFTTDRSLVENIAVRMDSLLPTDYIKRKVMEGNVKRKYFEISIDVELSVKHSVTVDIKHKSRVIASYSTAS